MGENQFAPVPTALYGVILLMAGVRVFAAAAVIIIVREGQRLDPGGGGRAGTGRARSSLLLYAVGIALAFLRPWIAGVVYVAVALMWLVPDRRIERALSRHEH